MRGTLEATRSTLLAGAARLLQTRSFADLTVAAIAREAGVSRQTVYVHFADADDVAASVFVAYADEHWLPGREAILARGRDANALEEIFWADIEVTRAFFPADAAAIAGFILRSQRMRDYLLGVWLPVLERFDADGLLARGLDLRAAAEWLFYQQTWLGAHPATLTDERASVRAYVIGPLLR